MRITNEMATLVAVDAAVITAESIAAFQIVASARSVEIIEDVYISSRCLVVSSYSLHN